MFRMRVLMLISILFILTLVAATPHVEVEISQENYVLLADYGRWIEVPEFGKVWKPDVLSSWRPYKYGEWTWSDQGWLWVSYEMLDWMIYHYGNWYFDGKLGWYWVPGYDWSPAQVSWITIGDYVGWAARPPEKSILPIPLLPDPRMETVAPVWTIVKAGDFMKENVGSYAVPGSTPKLKGTLSKKPPTKEFIEDAAGLIRIIKIDPSWMILGSPDFHKLVVKDREQIVRKYRDNPQMPVLHVHETSSQKKP